MNLSLFDDHKPALPYNGTSGWSGSKTSEERATEQDKNGTTTARQQNALRVLRNAGSKGLTWKEASRILDLHHGAISGVLSVLHKQGLLIRLTERRNRCQVYVLPEFANGREIAEYRPNVSARILVNVLTELEGDLIAGDTRSALDRVRKTLEAWQ